MPLFRKKSPTPAPVEHAVIVHFNVSGDEFGEVHEREAIFAMEEALIQAIDESGVGEFDGNEFGGGEAILYAYGPNADDLFAAMEPHLRAFDARPAWCILRYGEATDPNAEERRIDL
jgi:hypothetical protein